MALPALYNDLASALAAIRTVSGNMIGVLSGGRKTNRNSALFAYDSNAQRYDLYRRLNLWTPSQYAAIVEATAVGDHIVISEPVGQNLTFRTDQGDVTIAAGYTESDTAEDDITSFYVRFSNRSAEVNAAQGPGEKALVFIMGYADIRIISDNGAIFVRDMDSETIEWTVEAQYTYFPDNEDGESGGGTQYVDLPCRVESYKGCFWIDYSPFARSLLQTRGTMTTNSNYSTYSYGVIYINIDYGYTFLRGATYPNRRQMSLPSTSGRQVLLTDFEQPYCWPFFGSYNLHCGILYTKGSGSSRPSIIYSGDVRSLCVERCLPQNPIMIWWINSRGGIDYWCFGRHVEEKTAVSTESEIVPLSNARRTYPDSNREARSLKIAGTLTVGQGGLSESDFRALEQMAFSSEIYISGYVYDIENYSRRITVNKYEGKYVYGKGTYEIEFTFNLPPVNAPVGL